MATILFAWELGAGPEHVSNLGPLARHLARQGHAVALALRDLSRASLVFPDDEVRLLQAPTKVRIDARHIESPPTFAHILSNVGFGDIHELSAMVAGWRSLYRWLKPDVIVFDHSPTALLAAGTETARRVLLGAGFHSPPDGSPMPQVRPALQGKDSELAHVESEVLATVNSLRARAGLAAWNRLSQLYSDVHENILTTFRELDPYERREASYWGIGPNVPGAVPDWPCCSGQRIFADLKPFPALPALLDFLNRVRQPTLICADDVDRKIQSHFRSETLRFANAPIDLGLASRQCDLAILNGTHASTATMLLAGKPVMQIPITGEQFLTARRTTALGCGPSAPCTDAQTIISRLEWLLGANEPRQAARRIAARYDGFDPVDQVRQVAARIDQLVVASPALK
jgi:hypothetical protein